MSRPSQLKSIPESKSIATLLSLSADGSTSAVTGQGYQEFDLQSLDSAVDATNYRTNASSYHEGLLRIIAKTQNGQGDTATSPGASKTYTFYYAFVHERLTSAPAAVSVLDNIKSSLSLPLPDSSSSGSGGTRYHATDNFVHGGRYLYVWYDRSAFADANAKCNVTVSLVRL